MVMNEKRENENEKPQPWSPLQNLLQRKNEHTKRERRNRATAACNVRAIFAAFVAVIAVNSIR